MGPGKHFFPRILDIRKTSMYKGIALFVSNLKGPIVGTTGSFGLKKIGVDGDKQSSRSDSRLNKPIWEAMRQPDIHKQMQRGLGF
jgi:hypothetical protein